MNQGRDEHYQPWLRSTVPPPSGRVPSSLADEAPLGVDLARYEADADPAPPPHLVVGSGTSPRVAGPTVGERFDAGVALVRRGLGAFADWTIRLGAAADVPARVAAMEIGPRSRAVLGRIASGTARGTAATMRASRRGGAGLAKRAGSLGKQAQSGVASLELDRKLGVVAGQVAGKVRDGAGTIAAQVREGAGKLAEGGRELGSEAAQKLTPRAPEAPPPPESGLAKLLAREGLDQPAPPSAAPATRVGDPALPLFVTIEPAEAALITSGPRPVHDAPAATPRPDPVATTASVGAGAGQASADGKSVPPQPAPPQPAPLLSRQTGGNNGGAGDGTALPWWRGRGFWPGAVAGALVVGLPGAWWLGTLTGGPDDAHIASVMRQTLLAEPELVPQAMTRFEQRAAASAVDAVRASIEKPFAGAWAGDAKGDVTLVLFSDYACGFCRKSVADVDRLLASDPDLKVVYRELPILSEGSADAAIMSLRAAQQGKYSAFHHAMFAAGAPTPDAIAAAARNAGLNLASGAPAPDDATVKRELEGNLAVARRLQFEGTPSWVIGDRVLHGAVGYDELKSAIAEARKG